MERYERALDEVLRRMARRESCAGLVRRLAVNHAKTVQQVLDDASALERARCDAAWRKRLVADPRLAHYMSEL